MWIKLLLKREDIKKAIKTYPEVHFIDSCCPIFQALKRQGLKPRSVGYTVLFLNGSHNYKLSSKAIKITHLNSYQWENLLKTFKEPMEFSIRPLE